MPFPILAAVIGGGALLGSALVNRSAAKSAANSAENAADQNAAVTREIFNLTRSDLAPYTQAGQAALPGLVSRVTGAQPGVPNSYAPPPVMDNVGAKPNPAATPTAPAPGPDYGAYLTANPDVMAEYQSLASRADPNSPWFAEHGLDRGAEGFAQWHYGNFGQNEGRALPQTAPQQPAPAPAPSPQPAAQPQSQGPAAGGVPDYMNATRPDAGPAPQFTRPQDMNVPTYQRQADMAAPNAEMVQAFNFDPKNWIDEAGVQYELQQGARGVNAASAVRGKLRSGDAALELVRNQQGIARQGINDAFGRAIGSHSANRAAVESNRNFNEDRYRYGQNRIDDLFSQDRSYGTNLWNVQQTRADNNFAADRGFGTDAYRWNTNRADDNFDADRGYQTSRYDQQTANLFGLAGMGQNAAAGQANAGNVFAQQTVANNNNRATNQANAAIAGAQGINNLFGSAAQAVGYYGAGKGWF